MERALRMEGSSERPEVDIVWILELLKSPVCRTWELVD